MNDAAKIAIWLFIAGIVVGLLRWLADRHIKRIDTLAAQAATFITADEVDVEINGLLKRLDELGKEGAAGDRAILTSITEVRRDMTHEMRDIRTDVQATHKRIDTLFRLPG